MREWPSIVPATSEDYDIVVDHYGRFGTAFAETNINRADYETTVADWLCIREIDQKLDVTPGADTGR